MTENRDKGDFTYEHMYGLSLIHIRFGLNINKSLIILDLQSVVPLNEECGLIEWVPNLVGLRPTIMNLYNEKGIACPNRELKAMICRKL